MTYPTPPADRDGPISDLDRCLDDLAVALQENPDLEGFVIGLRAYEEVLGVTPISHPAAIEAIGVSRIWSALAAAGTEILKLREAANGDQK